MKSLWMMVINVVFQPKFTVSSIKLYATEVENHAMIDQYESNIHSFSANVKLMYKNMISENDGEL